jgi:hypothetical protein
MGNGVIKDTTIKKLAPIKISDILDNLIDQTVLYKLDNKYKDYFTNKKYDYYPVVGVSKKAAEYYCIWKTEKENYQRKEQGLPPNQAYRLPFEQEWDYVAQQSLDNKKSNKSIIVLQKSNEGIANTWGLTHLDDNVSEWVSSSRETNAIARGGSWKTDANITERQVLDPNSKEGYIGFRIVQSYLGTSLMKK